LGVRQDYVKAREWYEKAAAQDSRDAMRSLSDIYEKGLGVPKNAAKAREWRAKANAPPWV
jgi:TPR repeat protein